VVYFLFFPEKAERVGSWIYRFLAWIHHSFDGSYVALDIQAGIDSYAKRMNNAVDGLMPFGAKIEWVKEVDREAFLQGNDIVIKMDYRHNQDKNFVNAIATFVPKALLPYARQYIYDKIMRAIDFTVIKRMIEVVNRVTAMDYFAEEILTPTIEEDPKIVEFCSTMDDLGEAGLFARILLCELLILGRKLYPRISTTEITSETREFVKFLSTIATKEKGEDVPLEFSGKFLNVTIVLIARKEKRELGDPLPYIRAIQIARKAKPECIYVVAKGENIFLAQQVFKHFKQHPKMKVERKDYNCWREPIPAVCIRLIPS